MRHVEELPVVAAARAYRAVLRLYPRDYRIAFAAEMVVAFESGAAERRNAGFVTFAFAELTGALAGAATEWIAKRASNPAVRGRSLPDALLMRPPGVSWDAWYCVDGKRRCW